MKEKHRTKAYERTMRNRGYADGLAGREPRSQDPIYKESWRKGVKRKDELGNET